jgi:hypothetical protein
MTPEVAAQYTGDLRRLLAASMIPEATDRRRRGWQAYYIVQKESLVLSDGHELPAGAYVIACLDTRANKIRLMRTWTLVFEAAIRRVGLELVPGLASHYQEQQ